MSYRNAKLLRNMRYLSFFYRLSMSVRENNTLVANMLVLQKLTPN